MFQSKKVLISNFYIRLFGVTTLDSVRFSTFIAENKNFDPTHVRAPIVGGHSGVTIVPLFSKANAKIDINEEELKALTKRVQFGGDEVVKAKDGGGSATLSMAHAGARFANALLDAIIHNNSTIESSYVSIDADTTGASKMKELLDGCVFFAFDIKLSVIYYKIILEKWS